MTAEWEDVVASVIVRGETSALEEASLAWLEGHDGAGLAPVRRLTEQGPNQHGDTDLGFRLQPRFLTLYVGMREPDLYAKRRALLRALRPSNKPIILRFVLPDGGVRQIDCHVAGDIKLSRSGKDGEIQKAAIVLRCANPLFYDPAPQGLSMLSDAGGSGMDVPMPVDTDVGGDAFNKTSVINYAGDWPAPVRLRINGPIDDPIIVNESTGKILDFTGLELEAGEWIEVNSAFDEQTVLDQDGEIRLNALSDDSDLDSFWIDDEQGTNVIEATGTGATGATRVDINFLNWYTGL